MYVCPLNRSIYIYIYIYIYNNSLYTTRTRLLTANYNIVRVLALYKSYWAAMNKIFINYTRPCINKDFFMCFSSLFLSTKYQKIDDLFICNEFSSIFCEQTNSTLNESRGLSRVNVAEENYSELL